MVHCLVRRRYFLNKWVNEWMTALVNKCHHSGDNIGLPRASPLPVWTSFSPSPAGFWGFRVWVITESQVAFPSPVVPCLRMLLLFIASPDSPVTTSSRNTFLNPLWSTMPTVPLPQRSLHSYVLACTFLCFHYLFLCLIVFLNFLFWDNYNYNYL